MKDDQQCISLRALIVEDEILVAEELRHRLLALGFAVIAVVDTADEAVSIVARDRPDLVLMDIRLNGKKDGIQAAHDIHNHIDVPIVFITAYSDRINVERAKATQHDGFILKPFHNRELRSTIQVALKRHTTRIQAVTGPNIALLS